MSVVEWKNLIFFRVVPWLEGLDNKLSSISSDITCYCSNETYCVFCDLKGYVYLLKPKREKMVSFRAHAKAVKKSAINNTILVLLIQDEETKDVFLQVYNLLNTESKEGVPICIYRTSWASQMSVCSLQVTVKDETFIIAIGNETGQILLHRGQFRDASLNFRRFSIASGPIKNIEFNKDKAIFICTASEIYCYTPIDNIYFDKKVVLDTKNSNTCSALQVGTEDPFYLVGRKNAVYCFTTDGKGPCYAVDGNKTSIVGFRNYLAILVSKDLPTTVTTLIVIDIENKLIALQKTVNSGVGLLTNGTDCYVITNKNELFLLEELSLQKKIQLLLSKNLHEIAFKFINADTCQDIVADAYMRCGDYNLLKNKSSLAVQNYIKTIGSIDPYIIIRKLLDLRQNDNLLQYLQALVQSRNANKRHVHLLLKCNERQNLSSNLDTYLTDGIIYGLPQYSLSKSEDLKTREVLLNHNLSSYLKVIRDEKLSFQFISNMENVDMYNFISEYGGYLFTHYPQQTIAVLKKIFISSNSELLHSPENLTPLLLEHEVICKDLLDHIVLLDFNCNKSLLNTLFEFYLHDWSLKKITFEKVMNFLTKYSNKESELHMILACKSYYFCPNLLFFCNYSVLQKFYRQSFFNLVTSDTEIENTPTREFDSSVQVKTGPKTNSLFKFSGCLNEETFSSHKTLEVAHNISKNKTLLILCIKKYIHQQKTRKVCYKRNRDVIKIYLSEKKKIVDALRNFLSSPIEFRSNSCNICRQEIHLPAVYFLCKHVFHRECLSLCSQKETCIVCTSSLQEIHKILNCDTKTESTIASSINVTKEISEIVANGLLSHNYRIYIKPCVEIHKFYSEALIRRVQNPRKTYFSTNPFEASNTDHSTNQNPFEEYDANSNPVNEFDYV